MAKGSSNGNSRTGLSSLGVRTIEIFVAAAESGSMSGAAEVLGITQSAVSQAVFAFEQAVNKKLFDRSVRPPALTLVGRRVLKHAVAILDQCRQLEQATSGSEGKEYPMLKIGMLDSFAASVGPYLIEHIRHVADQWSVTSISKDTRLQALVDRSVDFIITSDRSPTGGEFTVKPLLSEPYILALPKDFSGDLSSIKKIAEALDFVGYGSQLHMSSHIADHFRNSGAIVSTRYQFDTVDAVMGMVASGHGWTITTPIHLLKVANWPTRIRCEPLPKEKFRREVRLIGRANDEIALASLIHQVLVEALQKIVLPQAKKWLPKIAGGIKIYS